MGKFLSSDGDDDMLGYPSPLLLTSSVSVRVMTIGEFLLMMMKVVSRCV